MDSPLANPVFEFPPAVQRKAVAVDAAVNAEQGSNVEVLTVPASSLPGDALMTALHEWVDEARDPQASPSLVMSLQHVQVVWSPARIAIVAASDRLPAVRNAVIETTYYVTELDEIENEIGAHWPQLEADLPLAFEFDEQASRQKKRLLKHFQQVFTMRTRLARMTPFLLCPHTYPPTLASQVGERLRERLRVEQREEFISDQLETFEEVYEMCGQRANDYKHARTGHTLEIIIIVLLAAEVLLAVFDYMTAAGA